MCQREQKMEKHGGQSWITLLNCKRENIDCCDCFVVVTRTRRQTLMVCLLWWFDVWSWMLQWLVTNGVVLIDFGHDGFVESSDDNALCCCGSWNHKHLTRMMVVDVWCHDHEQRHVALPQTFMLCSVQGELWMHCCVHWKLRCWEAWWRQWIVGVEWQWHMAMLWFCDFVILWPWKWLDCVWHEWTARQDCAVWMELCGCDCGNDWINGFCSAPMKLWLMAVDCCWLFLLQQIHECTMLSADLSDEFGWFETRFFLTFRSSENSCVTWLLLCAWLCVEQRLVVVCVHGRVLLLWMLWQEWLHVDSRRFSDLLWLCLWKCLWVNVFCLFFDCVVLCCVVEHEKMSAWKLFVVVFICCCWLWKLLVWSNIPIFDKTMLILCGDVFEHKHNNNMKIVKRGNWAIVFDECNVICKVFEMLLNVDWFVSICVVNEWTWDGGDWTGARSERDCVQWLLREWFHGVDCCDCCNAHTREKRHLLLCDCCERNLSVDGQWCERLIVDLLIVRHVECWWIEDEWWNFVVDCWRWMERCGWFVNCECVVWEAFFFLVEWRLCVVMIGSTSMLCVVVVVVDKCVVWRMMEMLWLNLWVMKWAVNWLIVEARSIDVWFVVDDSEKSKMCVCVCVCEQQSVLLMMMTWTMKDWLIVFVLSMSMSSLVCVCELLWKMLIVWMNVEFELNKVKMNEKDNEWLKWMMKVYFCEFIVWMKVLWWNWKWNWRWNLCLMCCFCWWEMNICVFVREFSVLCFVFCVLCFVFCVLC